MGRPKPIKRQKARNAEYYDMQKTQDDLYKRSLGNQNFVKLMNIVQCNENIMLAYRNIKRNGGSQTPGTDGKSIDDLEKLSPEQLTQYVRNRLKWYKPQPVKRVPVRATVRSSAKVLLPFLFFFILPTSSGNTDDTCCAVLLCPIPVADVVPVF